MSSGWPNLHSSSQALFRNLRNRGYPLPSMKILLSSTAETGSVLCNTMMGSLSLQPRVKHGRGKENLCITAGCPGSYRGSLSFLVCILAKGLAWTSKAALSMLEPTGAPGNLLSFPSLSPTIFRLEQTNAIGGRAAFRTDQTNQSAPLLMRGSVSETQPHTRSTEGLLGL